jgi:hypothetical protein
LKKYAVLPAPITLEDIRAKAQDIRSKALALEKSVGAPLYMPFEIRGARPLRPMQGYLFKLPSFFVSLFGLPTPARSQRRSADSESPHGASYREADEVTNVAAYDPFTVDPTLVEKALREHAQTQNALAEAVRQAGAKPMSPSPSDPNFDLAWHYAGTLWVAEIKSLREENEENQLRLGLGQVLRYRKLLRARGKVRAVLAVSRQPTDPSWHELCADCDVDLVWRQSWNSALFRSSAARGKQANRLTQE